MAVSDIQAYISLTATRLGVDPALALGVAQVESGFNQSARSSKGAIGVFQLMPATAAGLGVDPTVQNENIRGGVTLLAQLMKQYGGNTTLALAAYNAGAANVARYNGVPPFPETQKYVVSVAAAQSQFAGTSPAVASASFSDGLAAAWQSFQLGVDPLPVPSPEIWWGLALGFGLALSTS